MDNADVFENALEAWAPEALQVTYSYADAHDAVECFWVIVFLGATTTPSAVYQAAGEILQPHELDRVIPELDCSADAQGDYLLMPLLETVRPFYATLLETDVAVPTRIVLHYDVAEETMEASVCWDDLQPGVPESEQVSNTELLEQWVARLRATGNDSADA